MYYQQQSFQQQHPYAHQTHHHHHHSGPPQRTGQRQNQQHRLPQNVLVLFAPRPPLPFVTPTERNTHEPYTGVAEFVRYMEDPNVAPKPEPYEIPLTRLQKKEAKEKLRKEKYEKELIEKLSQYNPKEIENATEDAYKTLFVSRLSYTLTEEDLKKEFEKYGPIKQVKLIRNNQTGKSRGYAFIEYEHTSDMKQAFKHADGAKLDGRRIKVDVERGRTVKNWRPRRLGGGLGETRSNQAPEIQEPEPQKSSYSSRGSSHSSSSHYSSRPQQHHPYSREGGGDRSGYRGGRYGDSSSYNRSSHYRR